MAMPVLNVQFAPGDNWNTASPTWVEITNKVLHGPGLRITRGRQTPFTRGRPGKLTLTLDNSSGDFDPDNASGSYANDLVPLVPIRVRATHNAVTYDVFRGFVVSWEVQQRDFKFTSTRVEAVDGFHVLQLDADINPYVEEVLADSPSVWYRFLEGAGTVVADWSGNNNAGTYEGSPTRTVTGGPITIGNSAVMTLDGTDDLVVFPDGPITGTNDWTIEAWVRADSVSANDFLYVFNQHSPPSTQLFGESNYVFWGISDTTSKQDIWTLAIDTPGSSYIKKGIGSSGAYGTTGWQHVALAFRNTTGSSGKFVTLFNGTATTYNHSTSTASNITTNFVDPPLAHIGNHIAQYTTSIDGFSKGDYSEVMIYNTKVATTRLQAHRTQGLTPWSGQYTDARVGAALDAIGWPSALRTLTTGKELMSSLTAANSVLQIIFAAADTEDSEVYIGKDGKLVFTNRDSRNNATLSATFSNDSGSDTPYRDFVWTADDSLLRNVIRVSNAASATQEARNASTTRYGNRVLSRTIGSTGFTNLQDQADWLAGEFGVPRKTARLTIIGHTGTSNADWAELLSRELDDYITVEVTPIDGGTQHVWRFFVEELRLNADAELWELTMLLVPADRQVPFTLNDSILGVLDSASQGLLGR